MSCSTSNQKISQLDCVFPENTNASNLEVYFESDGSNQVMPTCNVDDDCSSEEVFQVRSLAPSYFEIRVPKCFKFQGNFRCVTTEVRNTSKCSWPPLLADGNSSYEECIHQLARNLIPEHETSKDSFHAPEKIDDHSAEIVGTVVAIVLVVALLAIGLHLFKKFKSKLHQSLVDPVKVALISGYGSDDPQRTVKIPCISSPRLAHTLMFMGEYYTAQITLSPEQHRLVNMNVPKLFLAGPPGTGKTMVLLLKGIQWLREGHDVHVVSTGWWSIVSCSMLCHLLLQIKRKLQADNVATGQLHLVEFDFEKDMDTAMATLSDVMKKGPLYVIADEARPEKYLTSKTFLDKMTADISDLHIWASSYYIKDIPAGWQAEYLTTPFRFPLTVLKEVKKENVDYIKPYKSFEVSGYKDSPTVKQILHWGHGHTKGHIEECAKCGQETACFLHSLHGRFTVNLSAPSTGTTSTNTGMTSSKLKWKDILVLTSDRACNDGAMVTALRDAQIPVQIMGDDDTEDVATARSDVVWMADGDRVRGIERKVVVVLGVGQENVRLCHMSRCTSQLVIILDSQEDVLTI